MFLNASIPWQQCLVRREFLHDGREGHGEFVPAVAFGVASLAGRAVGFHAMTDVGAVVWRLPVHALAWRDDAPARPLDHLQLWDCFSYDVAVTAFDWLAGSRCRCWLKDRTEADGEYVLTLDWCGPGPAEEAGEAGHKCGHLIALDEGNYAILPNNRILWVSPSLVERPFAARPGYLTNTRSWKCEGLGRWSAPGEEMFYGVEVFEGDQSGIPDGGE